MTLYHGSSNFIVKTPGILITKFTKDFGWGFYCTEYEQQAQLWATRYGSGYVTAYEYEPTAELKRALQTLTYKSYREVAG